MKKILIIDGTSDVNVIADCMSSFAQGQKGKNPLLNEFVPPAHVTPIIVPMVGYESDWFTLALASILHTKVSSKLSADRKNMPVDPQLRLRMDQMLVERHQSHPYIIFVGNPAESEHSDKKGYLELFKDKITSMYGYDMLILNSAPQKKTAHYSYH